MSDQNDDDLVQTPPSTLDFDHRGSAVRSGGAKLDAFNAELTHTDARMAGGDVDADAQSAHSVGDETPGGDNPTPDQDIVDEIGQAELRRRKTGTTLAGMTSEADI
jgi:hypothetical protein